MASQLSDEEFQRLQTQLIELRTSNYGLEEQCRKLRTENQRLGEKLGGLEREHQKLQKTISKSRKAKGIDLLLNENENLQVKLEAQEDEFRLQSQTLLQELSSLVAANEKLEQELNALKKQETKVGASTDPEQEEQVEKSSLPKIIAEEHVRAEQELEELRETIQLFSSSEADGDQDDSVPSSEGDFVQVGESDVTYQKRNTTQTDILKKAEQKLQHLEVHQKNLTDTLACLQSVQKEKKKIETELKHAQEKLRRKQESLLQLQDEKEKLYTESRKAYDELQTTKDQELNTVKDQSQRLQVQLNNAQSTLQDYKEKTSQMILDMQSQILVLKEKNDNNSTEHLLELQAKVIELDCMLRETKEELQNVNLQKSQLEAALSSAQERLMVQQTLAAAQDEQISQLTTVLEECKLLAQKRKNLVDEMSIRMQQKSDDYKHQLANLTNEFSNREEDLKKQIETLQEEVEKLTPLQSQLDDALVQIKSLEAMRGWLERRQKEAEDSTQSTQTYYEGVLEHLKAEHSQELSHIKLSEKMLEEELAVAKTEAEKKNEILSRLEQQLHDAGEEKQLVEKKGAAVMKDLRRQLAGERKRAEKLQEHLRDALNEGCHSKTELNKSNDPETSSISSWSLMSGNCETRDSSTRENSIVAGPISNLNGNVSPQPEEQDLEQENYQLLSRVMALQQEKWVLEEKINHLEQGSSAMAEDLMRKSALIQFYCMEGRSDPVATSSTSPSTKRLSMKKFVEMLKGDEHVHESNRRMQRMLEETLTKNMHLQSNLEQLSREVLRLSKGTDT